MIPVLRPCACCLASVERPARLCPPCCGITGHRLSVSPFA